MTLLLALIALAAYFAMPDDWRRLLSQPGQSWLRLMESLPAVLPVPVRLVMAIVIPMLVLLVLIQGLREVGLSLLVFLPAMTLFYIPNVLGGARSILIGNLIQNQFFVVVLCLH